MPEDNTQDLVDIDTSGPGADVELDAEKVTPVEETVVEEIKEEPKVEEPKVEEPKVEESKTETKPEAPKEELEEYSEGVQKRIAKLTKKWREAERQKDAF